jgi:hypothetical protein
LISQDYKVYIQQKYVGYFYEADPSIAKKEDESDEAYRIRAYRIYKKGSDRKHCHMKIDTIFTTDYT